MITPILLAWAKGKISFSISGEMIEYGGCKDVTGAIAFTFDASFSSDERTGKYTLFFDRVPMVDGKCFEPKSKSEQDWLDAALDRSRQYLESAGYVVELV